MSFRKQKINENIVYLEETLEVNNNESRLSLKDSIQDDFDIERYCAAFEERGIITKLVREKLSGRERQIIIMRYGLGGAQPMTQQQVCSILGISRSYVSRLEKKALENLKFYAKEYF